MPSGIDLTQSSSLRSASRPLGASCFTDIALPLPGHTTNMSGAPPAPSCARSAVWSWSVGANVALIVTSGFSFL